MLLKLLGKEIEKSPVMKEFRTNEFALSTRYCPDHQIQAQRIDDDSIRCPLDGKVYNFRDRIPT